MKRPNRVFSEEGEERFYIKNKKGKKVYIKTSLSKDKVQKEFIKVYNRRKTHTVRKRRGTSYRNKPITNQEINRSRDVSVSTVGTTVGTTVGNIPQGSKDSIYMTDNEKATNLIKMIETNRQNYYINQGVIPPPKNEVSNPVPKEISNPVPKVISNSDDIQQLEGRLSQRIDEYGSRSEGRLSQRIDDIGSRALQQIENLRALQQIENLSFQSKDEGVLREDKPTNENKIKKNKKVISFSKPAPAITSSVRQIKEIERQNLIMSNIDQSDMIKKLDERILMGSEDTQKIERLTDLKKLSETQITMNDDIIASLNTELKDQTFLKEKYKEDVIAEQKVNKQLRMGLFQEKVSNILERNKVNKNIDFLKMLENENKELKDVDKERQQIIDKLQSQQAAERKTLIVDEGIIEEKLMKSKPTPPKTAEQKTLIVDEGIIEEKLMKSKPPPPKTGAQVKRELDREERVRKFAAEKQSDLITRMLRDNEYFDKNYNRASDNTKELYDKIKTSIEFIRDNPDINKNTKKYRDNKISSDQQSFYDEYNDTFGLSGVGHSTLGSNLGIDDYSDALYESQIKDIMKKEALIFCPVIARDEIKDIKIVGDGEPTFFVMNLSKRDATDGGSHWVSIYMDDNDISYFDPFGRDVPTDIKEDLITLAGKDILNTLRKFKINRKILQKDYQTDCGYRSVEFLDNMLEGKSFKESTNFTEKDMKKLKEKYPTEYV